MCNKNNDNFEKMTREQLELLCNIYDLSLSVFYMNMGDHLSFEELNKMSQWNTQCKKYESEYVEKYGNLPEIKYIDDISEAYKIIKKCINEVAI